MKAKELLDAGKVREAEKVLSAFLRNNPADTALRTFLFELLCFSGQYDRAEKQLYKSLEFSFIKEGSSTSSLLGY